MANPDIIEAIETLQQSQSNIKVFTAIPMGVLMILYFFSFATLIDRGMYAMLAFEIVTTVLFVAALIYLNRVSFVLLKMRYKNKPPYKEVLSCVSYTELAQDANKVSQTVESCRQQTA
ncbi:MAG: hypothetical protein PVG89_11150 [Gammaproteobacteria bacterium]|jgi:hypothetical protein